MNFTVHWIDVRPNVLSGQQPVFLLQRPSHGTKGSTYGFASAEVARLGEYWVPQAPVLSGDAWSFTRTGELVRIPVHAYKTEQRAIASLWGLALQVGMAAMLELRNHTPDIPQEVTLVLGHECTDLYPAEEAFRGYVGLAFKTK